MIFIFTENSTQVAVLLSMPWSLVLQGSYDAKLISFLGRKVFRFYSFTFLPCDAL